VRLAIPPRLGGTADVPPIGRKLTLRRGAGSKKLPPGSTIRSEWVPLELRQYLDILRRHKWFILEAVVVVALMAGVVSALRTPQYQATARILLKPNDPNEVLDPASLARSSFGDPDRYVAAQTDIITSEGVAQEALKSLVGLDAEDLGKKLSVAQSGISDVVEISGTDVDPVQARDIANAVAKGYIENRRQVAVAGLQRAVDDIESRLGPLQGRIAELDTAIGDVPTPGASNRPDSPSRAAPAPSGPDGAPLSGIDTGGVPTTAESLKAARYAAAVQYETLYGRQQELLVDMSLKQGSSELISLAETPTKPVSPQPKSDAALGGLVGLLLGAGIVFLREQLDDRLRSRTEISEVTELPLLAQLPFDQEASDSPSHLATIDRPSGGFSEAVRSLRTSIQYLGVETPVKVILVTSAVPGEGKSLVSANLAAAFAQAGLRTVLIGADLRRGGVSRMFPDTNNSPGLTGIVAGLPSNGTGPPNTEHRNGSGPLGALLSRSANLLYLPGGATPPNPAEILASKKTFNLIAQLSDASDIVVIDSPPLLPVTDAAVLAPAVSGIILVTALGESRREAVKRAKEIAQGTGARLYGVVVNKCRNEGGYGYGYGSYDDNGTKNTSIKPLRRTLRRPEQRPENVSTPTATEEASRGSS